eukprot:GHVS01063091.1.p2 GENE.GHVS01063091.1~~GHVS01063091.1.p2  ORF type:complete len:184 (-),score=26.23 GHVS01063091.1:159-710(-)
MVLQKLLNKKREENIRAKCPRRSAEPIKHLSGARLPDADNRSSDATGPHAHLPVTLLLATKTAAHDRDGDVGRTIFDERNEILTSRLRELNRMEAEKHHAWKEQEVKHFEEVRTKRLQQRLKDSNETGRAEEQNEKEDENVTKRNRILRYRERQRSRDVVDEATKSREKLARSISVSVATPMA